MVRQITLMTAVASLLTVFSSVGFAAGCRGFSKAVKAYGIASTWQQAYDDCLEKTEAQGWTGFPEGMCDLADSYCRMEDLVCEQGTGCEFVGGRFFCAGYVTAKCTGS